VKLVGKTNAQQVREKLAIKSEYLVCYQMLVL
jgi:hypothetical protein